LKRVVGTAVAHDVPTLAEYGGVKGGAVVRRHCKRRVVAAERIRAGLKGQAVQLFKAAAADFRFAGTAYAAHDCVKDALACGLVGAHGKLSLGGFAHGGGLRGGHAHGVKAAVEFVDLHRGGFQHLLLVVQFIDFVAARTPAVFFVFDRAELIHAREIGIFALVVRGAYAGRWGGDGVIDGGAAARGGTRGGAGGYGRAGTGRRRPRGYGGNDRASPGDRAGRGGDGARNGGTRLNIAFDALDGLDGRARGGRGRAVCRGETRLDNRIVIAGRPRGRAKQAMRDKRRN